MPVRSQFHDSRLFGDFDVVPREFQTRGRLHAGAVTLIQATGTGVDGYVLDNMEGAVDRATFFANTDMPIAIIGARGTGKMYVAGIVHSQSGGAQGDLVAIDCREFRNREEANKRIHHELEHAEGKTLVFKSPHLMSADAQLKLARQLTTRTLADVSPPRYLPRAKFVALFPDTIERLTQHAGLNEKLASAFAGYPIHVPPIKDRGQAVLRWAHKILGQERGSRDHRARGFTPDAEQAMLVHEWNGNISEIRQRIVRALDGEQKEWISAADLGLAQGHIAAVALSSRPFLEPLQNNSPEPTDDYTPTAEEELDVALGQAALATVSADTALPLGLWLADEIVLAVRQRYAANIGLAAEFLQTSTRNLNRWQPKIEERECERNECDDWQEPRRLVRDWIREAAARATEPPLATAERMLLSHLERQRENVSTRTRAQILGVSTPTYLKKLRAVGAGDK